MEYLHQNLIIYVLKKMDYNLMVHFYRMDKYVILQDIILIMLLNGLKILVYNLNNY